MNVFVFLGPSLPVDAARELLPATYLPPVQQGDILRLLRERKPDVIGIVDGFFETVPAVWHKEILFALEEGVRVFGAASMGALRAAELHPFGMVGVGMVFEWFRDGTILCDDEVAVIHAPADLGYRPLSDALVDIRDACAAAVRDGVISGSLSDNLIAAAKALPFAERSFEAVARAVAPVSDHGALQDWRCFCTSRGAGLKSRDTAAMLLAIAAALDAPAPPLAGVEVERTTFFERLRLEVALAPFVKPERTGGGGRPGPTFDWTANEPRSAMLLRILAREAAVRFGWQLNADEVSEHASQFFARMGLSDLDTRWMQSRFLSDGKFWRFVNDSLFIAKLERLLTAEIDAELADHLRSVTVDLT
jgi:hypothetical protein